MILETETAYGKMTFYGKDEYIGRSLYAYGEWSGDECDMLRGLASGVFVDVGANIGAMSMAVAATGRPVLAFEPQPALYSLLVKNCTGLPVSCFNLALSSVAGHARMPKIRYGDRGNYGGLGFGRSDLGSIEVECKTLDSLVSRSTHPVGLIKIDVEGHELQVLRGASELINDCRPILYVEDDREDKRWDLRAYIKKLGYTIEEHNPSMYRENNYRGLKKNIWGINYVSMNLICRPC